MKITKYLAALFLTLITATGAKAVDPLILITGFDPFNGATVNQSWVVVQEVKKSAARLGLVARVEICQIPTSFSRDYSAFEQCINQVRINYGEDPKWIVSLGEGSCYSTVEANGRNYFSASVADNDGFVGVAGEIIPGAATYLPLDLPDAAFTSVVNKHSSEINWGSLTTGPSGGLFTSTFGGSYVCNDLAYKAATYLPTTTRFTFMHVPNHKCASKYKNPKVVAPIVADVINAALAVP